MIEIDLFELSKINTLRLIHMGVCIFSAMLIIFVMVEAKKSLKKNENLWGLIFISFAYFLWGAIDLYRYSGLMVVGSSNVIIKTFSAYNNAFFLAAIPFFYNEVNKLKGKKPLFNKPFLWALGIILINVFIVMLYSLSWSDQSNHSNFVKDFDVVYSFLTFLGLGFALTKAYLHQKNVLLAGITIVISIILMLMQIMFSNIVKINHYDLLSVISLFSHTVLAMLVLVLAKSWMFEESATEHNFAEVELSDKFSKLQIEYSTVNDQNQILKNEIESLNTNRVLLESKILQGKDALQIKDLSEREVSVLRLINKSYSEIAELLFISRETVITHKKNIEGKLGISGKENLVQYAIEKGLIIP